MPNPWDALPAGPGLWELQVRLAKQPQQIGVPTYFAPCSTSTSSCKWSRIKGNTGVVIFNPNNGPNSPSTQTQYAALSTELKANGTLVLGYVYTSYSARSAAVVKAEIDTYYASYGVSGIFLDQGNGSCNSLAYYEGIISYIKTSKNRNSLVALNWGTYGAECYMTSVNRPDVVVNFQGSYSNYLTWNATAFAPWTIKYPASRFWHLVHSTSSTNAAQAFALSRSRRAGLVYITNDGLPNPWDTVSSYYLTSEVAAVANTTTC
jgi:hypothetical protein